MSNFTKMQGLGNSFLLFDEFKKFPGDSETIQRLCDPQQGAGADGVILVTRSEGSDTIGMRFFNADGGEAAMCGNGIRCVALYARERNFVESLRFPIKTLSGVREVEILSHNNDISEAEVSVNMGKPTFSPDNFPQYVEIETHSFRIHSLDMCVPHVVIFTENIDEVPVIEYGPLIERLPLFPQGTNVNFVQLLNRDEILVRTWERGAGQTLACGTGACASAVVSAYHKKTERNVKVHLMGGVLQVSWQPNGDVIMAGNASFL